MGSYFMYYLLCPYAVSLMGLLCQYIDSKGFNNNSSSSNSSNNNNNNNNKQYAQTEKLQQIG